MIRPPTLLFVAFALLGTTPAATLPSEIDQYTGALASSDVHERRLASEKLGRSGEAARAAVPALIRALADPDDLVRRNAAWALGKIRAPRDKVIAALAAKLHEEKEDWTVRHNTALSLSWIGEPAVPALQRGLEAKTEWTRAYAADALIRIGGEERTKSVVPVVNELLASPDVEVRTFAATLAARLGPQAGPMAERLAALLDETADQPRISAMKALVDLGPAARVAVPRVKRALREDPNQWVRIGAVQVLAESPGNEPEIIRLLVEAFADSKERVGSYAVQSIARFKEAAVPPLLTALEAENPRVRLCATEALALIGNAAGGSDAAATTALVGVLAEDEDWRVRSLAATALGTRGLVSHDVVTALQAALRDEHEIVRLNAGDALKRLGQPAPTNSSVAPAGAMNPPTPATPRQA